jgi:hypothetical protein
MADGRPIHGWNAYIYVSGAALTGGNGWTCNTTKATVDTPQFGKKWIDRVWGQLDGSGSITAWQHQDKKVLLDAVQADGPVATYIYPDKADPTNYVSGDLIYTSRNLDGSTTSGVGGTADFVSCDGDAGLTYTGFA